MAGELKAFEDALTAAHRACVASPHEPTAERHVLEASLREEVAMAVRAAVAAGQVDAVRTMLAGAQGVVPATGASLWRSVLGAADHALPAPGTGESVLDMTVDRGSLDPAVATESAAPPLTLPSARATESPRPMPEVPSHGGTSLPVEVVLVSLGLFAVGALVLYPVFRYGLSPLGHLADSNQFVRAFAALTTYVVVTLAATGVALVLLAVGLWRASRPSQLLTCLLCGVVAFVELAEDRSSGLQLSATADGTRAAIVIVCLLIIGLLVLPGARRHFRRDSQRPVGVAVGCAVGWYFGGCAVLSGLVLMIAGTLGAKYVWWGLASAAFGLAVIGLNRLLMAGRNSGRVAVSLCYVAYVVLGFVIADASGGEATASSLIPLGIAVMAIGGLWLPQSSQEHFRQSQDLPTFSPPLAAAMAIGLMGTLALAVAGFHAASSRENLASTPFGGDSSQIVSPSVSTPISAAAAPSLDESTAEQEADAAFSAMTGTASVDTCDGALPTLPISDYTIAQVSPDSTGSFWVSADVTLDDGTTETVSVLIAADSDGQPCVDAGNVQMSNVVPPTPTVAATPSDVPNVPSANDPVPVDAPLPDPPQDGPVVAYGDDSVTPTDASQIVEYQPDGLGGDQQAAVASVISFMTYVNQQDFASAWDTTTDRLVASSPSSAFRRGYRTSRFFQVAFGQPRVLGSDLIVVPARFVSRQDPEAQGNPDGVTDCTYWPQYVFVVGKSDGQWLVDVAGKYSGRRQLSSLKRPGDDGLRYVNPVSQRVAC